MTDISVTDIIETRLERQGYLGIVYYKGNFYLLGQSTPFRLRVKSPHTVGILATDYQSDRITANDLKAYIEPQADHLYQVCMTWAPNYLELQTWAPGGQLTMGTEMRENDGYIKIFGLNSNIPMSRPFHEFYIFQKEIPQFQFINRGVSPQQPYLYFTGRNYVVKPLDALQIKQLRDRIKATYAPRILFNWSGGPNQNTAFDDPLEFNGMIPLGSTADVINSNGLRGGDLL